MYLGLLMLLWPLRPTQTLGFAGPLAFALFVARFQIIPKHVLSAKFGDAYRAYDARSPLALMQETRAAMTPNYDAILIGSGMGGALTSHPGWLAKDVGPASKQNFNL